MSAGGRLEARFTVPSAVTISVTSNAGGPTVVTIAAGSYTPTSFCAYLQSALIAQRSVTAGTWTVTLSTGRTGTGFVTIAVTAGTFSITWTSTLLRDILGFTATITAQTSSTGPQQCLGLWLPDCPTMTDLDPTLAPRVTDSRSVESANGLVITHTSTSKRVHKGLRYSHVLQAKIRETAAVTAGYTHSSLEQWINDTQISAGHTWFSAGSAFHVYWDNAGTDSLLGLDANSGTGPATGWCFSPAISDLSEVIRRVDAAWNGVWAVTFPPLVSEG